ncbi:MAG TPA: FixH family protein, partial [Chloroflexia bacterium]|nr:FixH family protein [Chloroflexia bacterium]
GADCALSVKLTLTQLEDNTSATVSADDAGGGRYAVPIGPYLALDGTWQIVVAVRRYNQPEDVKAAFRYTVAGTTLTGRPSAYVNVDVTTSPDPPRSGPVAFTFHLTDNNGRPVNDATVTMQGIMPTHGHVTELLPLQAGSGAYTGKLVLPMSGGWAVELSIARPGQDTVAAEVALDLAPSEYDLTPYPSPNITPAAP